MTDLRDRFACAVVVAPVINAVAVRGTRAGRAVRRVYFDRASLVIEFDRTEELADRDRDQDACDHDGQAIQKRSKLVAQLGLWAAAQAEGVE